MPKWGCFLPQTQSNKTNIKVTDTRTPSSIPSEAAIFEEGRGGGAVMKAAGKSTLRSNAYVAIITTPETTPAPTRWRPGPSFLEGKANKSEKQERTKRARVSDNRDIEETGTCDRKSLRAGGSDSRDTQVPPFGRGVIRWLGAQTDDILPTEFRPVSWYSRNALAKP